MPIRYPKQRRPPKLVYREDSDLTMGEITLRRLAMTMKVELKHLQPLVKLGVLKTTRPTVIPRGFGDIVVERPSRAVLVWLLQMMRPIYLRPLVRLTEVAEQLDLSLGELRSRCDEAGLTFHKDPAFGELLSPHDIGKVLMQCVGPEHDLPRFDRMAMVQFLMGDPIARKMKYHTVPYMVRLERELKRVARMRQPYKTLHAVNLMESLRDAKSIVGALREYRHRLSGPEALRAEEAVEKLMSDIVRDTEAPPAEPA